EQAAIDSTVNLGPGGASGFVPPPNPFFPPPDPPAPTPLAGYLPIVIVNSSGFPDTDVYISVIGTQLIGTTATSQKMYMTFNASGVGSYTNVPNSSSGSVPIIQLSTVNTPMAAHTYTIYIPANNAGSDGISGARIYFEIGSGDTLVTYSAGQL